MALAQYEEVVFETDEVPKEMMTLLGIGIPHYVQKYFTFALDESKANGRHGITSEDVRNAYFQRMLGSLGQADMSSYYERIERVLGEEMMPLAIELLTEAAVVGILSNSALSKVSQLKGFEKLAEKNIVRELLEILIHDGYLKQTDNGYVFVFKLLKDWWKRRYGFEYIPFEKRAKQS